MKRRKFIYQASMGVGGLLPVLKKVNPFVLGKGPFLATGIKTGEITQTEAIVWARLTKEAKPVGKQAAIPTVLYKDESVNEWHPTAYFKEKYKQDRPNREVKVIFPDGYTVSDLEGAVPGTDGELRFLYRKQGTKKWSETAWMAVDGSTDYATQVKLQHLQPDTRYELNVETRFKGSGSTGQTMSGSLKTAAMATDAKDVHFMVTTCHEYNHQDDPDGKGFKIYQHMKSLQPDFMVHTGDVIYYDQLGKSLPLAYWHWQRMFGLQSCVNFYKDVPTYFMKDDHDTWMNDCYPQWNNKFMGEFTFQQGVKVFGQQVPMGNMPYRTFRWGKDLQIWLVEGREYRDKNDKPDGPDKTIWGKEQMAWFKQSFEASDATYRILITPTPIVGPDRPQKKDNHANSGFAYEGNEIKQFLADKKNVFIACGDRHWQYASKDLKLGLREFACGPASNEHAEGWKKEDVLPEHKYLNIVGGFLSVKITKETHNTSIRFTHYSVDGEKLYSEDFSNTGV